MRDAKKLLIGSIVWAVAFMLSAYVFRGRPAGPWVQGVLLVVWTLYFSFATMKLPRRSC